MASPRKLQAGLAWVASLACLLGVPLQALGSGTSGMGASASVSSALVAVPIPSVPQVSVSGAEVPAVPAVLPSTLPVPVTLATPTTPAVIIPAGSTPSIKVATASPPLPLRSSPVATHEQSPSDGPAVGGGDSAGAAPAPSSSGAPGGSESSYEAARGALPARASAGGRQGQLRASLRAEVRRLAGCLGELPSRLRLVLELRTGIDAPHALSVGRVATHLHITVTQVSRLEQRALLLLRGTARAHACGVAGRELSTVLVVLGGGEPGGATSSEGGGAAGEVKAARYAKSPSQEPAVRPVKSALGISPPASLQDTTLATVIVLLLAGMLLTALLFGEKLQAGPRLRRWRARLVRRHPE